jgi:hypothetical protein
VLVTSMPAKKGGSGTPFMLPSFYERISGTAFRSVPSYINIYKIPLHMCNGNWPASSEFNTYFMEQGPS